METPEPEHPTRRRFLETTSAMAAGTMAGAVFAAEAEPVVPQPAPFLTDAEDFYTVARGNPKPHTLSGQALIDARMTPGTWRLEITADPATEPPDIKEAAEIDSPHTIADGTALDMDALMNLGKTHGVKYVKAMQCLNIAEPLGQGLWEGVPLRDVIRLCGEMKNVRRIYYRGFHNHEPKQIFQSSVSYTQAMETPPGELPVFLAYRLNGKPIPPVRGGPVRMIVPWAHGFKSIKWLQEIILTNNYLANDTYALRNNDPESHLKTAAYIDGASSEYSTGKKVVVVGQVISGLSGLKHVETWLRTMDESESGKLDESSPELKSASWKPCELLPPPDWNTVLPKGISSKDLLGFDSKTGEPLSWPTRYGMASWRATLTGLKPGRYQLYARAVDNNGFAQPEPRPYKKSGKNAIQFHEFKVV